MITQEQAVTEPWVLTRYGNSVSLINPKPEDINFREIADTLAHIYRWTGAAKYDISVAWHTLLCHDICVYNDDIDLIPHMLLHDAHEAFIGDISTPVARAIGGDALKNMKLRFDKVIYEAAGISEFSRVANEKRIKFVDVWALMNEHSVYLPDCGWTFGAPDFEANLIGTSRPPPRQDFIANRLYELFQKHLPCFTGEKK
jgi:hypothetical protein